MFRKPNGLLFLRGWENPQECHPQSLSSPINISADWPNQQLSLFTKHHHGDPKKANSRKLQVRESLPRTKVSAMAMCFLTCNAKSRPMNLGPQKARRTLSRASFLWVLASGWFMRNKPRTAKFLEVDTYPQDFPPRGHGLMFVGNWVGPPPHPPQTGRLSACLLSGSYES